MQIQYFVLLFITLTKLPIKTPKNKVNTLTLINNILSAPNP